MLARREVWLAGWLAGLEVLALLVYSCKLVARSSERSTGEERQEGQEDQVQARIHLRYTHVGISLAFSDSGLFSFVVKF